MKSRISTLTLGLFSIFAFLGEPKQAHALIHASVWSGFSVVGSAGQPTLTAFSPLLGIEATYGFGILQFGAFYTHNYLSYGDGSAGSLRFFGPVARIGLGSLLPGAFFDTRFGLSSSSVNGSSSVTDWGVGIGAGYRIDATPTISFSPRIALNTEPYQITSNGTTTSYSQTVWDLGLLVTVSF